jgi:hypothetical protein
MGEVKNQIISGEVPALKDGLKAGLKKAVVPAPLVQASLLFAAFLESCG